MERAGTYATLHGVVFSPVSITHTSHAATENAGVENAGVAAMERRSNTTRRQSSVFTNVATFVTYIIIIIC